MVNAFKSHGSRLIEGSFNIKGLLGPLVVYDGWVMKRTENFFWFFCLPETRGCTTDTVHMRLKLLRLFGTRRKTIAIAGIRADECSSPGNIQVEIINKGVV